MAGWHLRLWRRVRIAPGIRLNISKSGPSISLGPRGAHFTVGPRGRRETLGIPGTGLYATRVERTSRRRPTNPRAERAAPAELVGPQEGSQIEAAVPTTAPTGAMTSAPFGAAGSSTPSMTPAWPRAATAEPLVATPQALPRAGGAHYALAILLGLVLGVLLVMGKADAASAANAAVVTAVVGLGYEWLAHHHPLLARRLVAAVVGLVSVVSVFAAVFVGAVVLGALAGARSKHR